MNIEIIWQQYRSKLHAFLNSKVSNSADVEDLLQEILLKSHTKLATLKDQDKLKPWLYQLANHTVIDFYRKRGRSVNDEDLWYFDGEEDQQHPLSGCILPFIQALPEDSAQLLLAIDIEGHSQKEYAERHNMTYSTLKSRVQRARGQLRGLFDNCCQFELDRNGNVAGYKRKENQCGKCD